MDKGRHHFKDLSPSARLDWLVEHGFLESSDLGHLRLELADRLIENVIGTFGVPLGIALNLRVNQRDVLVPMVVEEPSVVAAQSHACKLVLAGGGFTAHATDPVMIGQIQLLNVPDVTAACARVEAASAELGRMADAVLPRLVERGGGWRGLETRVVTHPDGEVFMVVHLLVDVRDAMGANMVNTCAEHLSGPIQKLTGGDMGLRILSNLTDHRRAIASFEVPTAELAWKGFSGDAVADAVVDASRFAEADPYRAVTHNKGILNGVDALLVATGNDWRAVEAAAHAWAGREGVYRPLSRFWRSDSGALCGRIELPMAVGIVGGTTAAHPVAAKMLRLLDITRASQLAEIAACVGLAQNLAALKALGTEGIQQGHMRLHRRRD